MNPYSLTPEQRAGLYANLAANRAAQQVFEGRTAHLTPDSMYDLMLLATGDEEQAADAMAEKIRADQEAAINGNPRQPGTALW